MKSLALLLSLLLLSSTLSAQPPPFTPTDISGLEHWILPDRDALSSSSGDPNVLVTPDNHAVIEWLLAGQQVARTITGILDEVPPHGGAIWPPDVEPGDTVLYGAYEVGVAPGSQGAVRFSGTSPFTRYYWQEWTDLSTHRYLHDGTGCFVAFLFRPASTGAYQEILATADGADDMGTGLSIAYNGTDERVEIRVARGASGFAFNGNTGNDSVPLDTWTVVALRLKSTSPRVSAWVSTTQVISAAFANAPSSSDHSTFLQMSSSAHRFEGDLGELLVYHSAPANPDVNDAIRYLER